MTIAASASDSPFIQGRNARVQGVSRDACPYRDGTEDRTAWLQAWDEAGTGGEDGSQPEKDRSSVDGS